MLIRANLNIIIQLLSQYPLEIEHAEREPFKLPIFDYLLGGIRDTSTAESCSARIKKTQPIRDPLIKVAFAQNSRS